ncbi:hypothetical protein [Amycolatopsis kentuckyensis]|uniref:hypothetical protein n=1 Tax=Amycolatopsis kentuckyensis TaxID=218823 RepID=UPI001FC95309|nr:hypothetical protein [Amycolatopsis kentuckyensis]
MSMHAADDPLPRVLTGAGVPTELFARPARPAPVCYVDVAHQDGSRRSGSWLSPRRHDRETGGHPVSQHWLAGLGETMARHGHAYVAVAEGDLIEQGDERVMERLLAGGPRSTGCSWATT